MAFHIRCIFEAQSNQLRRSQARLPTHVSLSAWCQGVPARCSGWPDCQEASLALVPLPGEPSCREHLHPFNPEARLKEDDIFRRRPLDCPITHFAKVLKSDWGIVTVHLLQGLPTPEDIGICLVAAFEGT